MSDLAAWHSYPKIYAIGHKYLADLLCDEVLVQEKVDGSQFSFGKFKNADGEYELRCRSKGAQLNIYAPDNMFVQGVETAKELFQQLTPGWTYRGEYLAKPKHNVLAYSRHPERHVILYDIGIGHEDYMDPDSVRAEAAKLGLETVPELYRGKIENIEFFRSLLDRESVLGGQKIEGVVVKNYKRFGIDGKPLFGKFVSEAFKEVHAGEWRETNPTTGDILTILGTKYRTPARWNKAVQHLRESGRLLGEPKDIGALMREVAEDVKAECSDEIKEQLFQWAWKHIHRQITNGLPEWYKEELLKEQFKETQK